MESSSYAALPSRCRTTVEEETTGTLNGFADLILRSERIVFHFFKQQKIHSGKL